MQFFVLFGTCLFIGLAGILAGSLVYNLTGNDIPFDYGVTVDAGSTHTSFVLYQWKGDKEKGTGVIKQIDHCRTGAVTLIEPKMVEEALSPCLKNATRSIPAGSFSSTPVFLGATAGMRLLNLTSPYLAEAIRIAAQCMFQKSGLHTKSVTIISGEQEALYGWITSNFLFNTLQTNDISAYGALDLGGASTQISYTAEDRNTSTYNLRLYGKDYTVQAKSYQCFGVEQIFNRHTALLAKDLNPSVVIYDPCSPKNFTSHLNARNLLSKACTITDSYEDWLFHNRHDKIISFSFEGTGNVSECKKLVHNLLNTDECRKNFTDCFNPSEVVVPTSTQKFAAFSSFFYTTNFVNATNVTLSEFLRLSEELCELTWDEVQALPRKGVPFPNLHMMCFQAIYVYQLLTEEGYGFNETTWENLIFIRQVNNADVGWSIGYMINATNGIPAEFPTPRALNIVALISILIVSSIILLMGAFFFRKGLIARSTENRYLSV